MLKALYEGPKGLFVLVDFFVSLMAVCSNFIVLGGIMRAKFSLKGYRRFLISLTISDLFICAVNLASFVFQLSNADVDPASRNCGKQIFRSLELVGFFCNLLNLCGMTTDHVVGLIYPLKYQYLSKKRFAKYGVICIWLFSFILGFLDVPVAAGLYLFGVSKSSVDSGGLSGDFSSTSCSNSPFSKMLIDLKSDFPTDFGIQLSENGSINFQNSDKQIITRIRRMARQKSSNKTWPQMKTTSTPRPKGRRRASSARLKRRTTTTTLSANLMSSNGLEVEAFSGLMSTMDDDQLWSEINEINNALCNVLDNHVKRSQPQTDTDGGGIVSWCTLYKNNSLLEYCIIALTGSCFLYLAICYRKIFVAIFSSKTTAIPNRRTSNKLVITTCFLLGAFALCYLPFMTFEMSMTIVSKHVDLSTFKHSSDIVLVIHNVLNSLLMAYPLLDPIIYAARLPAVKKHILLQISKMLPCFWKHHRLASMDAPLSGGQDVLKRGASVMSRSGMSRCSSRGQCSDVMLALAAARHEAARKMSPQLPDDPKSNATTKTTIEFSSTDATNNNSNSNNYVVYSDELPTWPVPVEEKSPSPSPSGDENSSSSLSPGQQLPPAVVNFVLPTASDSDYEFIDCSLRRNKFPNNNSNKATIV